jgi:hypothetical protein
MRIDQLFRLPAAIFIACVLFLSLAPKEVQAVVLTVNPSDPTCGTSTNTTCYTSIQAAINGAVSLIPTTGLSYSVSVFPGTYSEAITLHSNIPIRGTETARAILAGSGTSAAITANGVANVDIQNFTFINAPVGILVTNSTSLSITNNVFEVGAANTAIQVSDSTSAPDIRNNTFYLNGTAILSASNNLSIANNIFHSNTLAISATVAPGGILNNLFFQNITIGPTLTLVSGNTYQNANIENLDPVFVKLTASDITKRDFHLKAGSPCINAGNAIGGLNSVNNLGPDIGAYGGSNADTIPLPISDLSITTTSGGSISLSWSQNTCYLIGGYNVSYGPTSGNYTTHANNASTILSVNTETYTITGLSTTAAAPAEIPQLSHTFASNAFNLTWSVTSSADITGYQVLYGTTSPPTITIDVKNTTSYPLGGLTNGITYYVEVVPYATPTYYIAVQAFYTAATPTTFVSAYSNEVNATLGSPSIGQPSNVISDFPESITANPDLPNKGCFIATAAYGYYSAPQVQALREFRDRYLVTNAPGRAFVQWYYRNGPVAARFINEHPEYKYIVRAALMPAVAGALFMTRTSMFVKMCVFAFICLLAVRVWVYSRRKLLRHR